VSSCSGPAIALIAAERVPALAAAVTAALAAAGHQQPQVRTVTPSAGARKDA
jgi:galactokinase